MANQETYRQFTAVKKVQRKVSEANDLLTEAHAFYQVYLASKDTAVGKHCAGVGNTAMLQARQAMASALRLFDRADRQSNG